MEVESAVTLEDGSMIDFVVKNRELAVAVCSVIVAIVGFFTACMKRNTSHTIRRETVITGSTSPGGGRSSAGGGGGATRSGDVTTGVSIVGDYLCVKNDSYHRSQVGGVTLRMGMNNFISIVGVLFFGFCALGIWSEGHYGAAIACGAGAVVGLMMASVKNVYLVTPGGERRIAKALFPGEATRVRREILNWRSGG